ncbi:MAG: hypothetical protein JWO90_1512 [Solirubrobacterales bacterium]|nr:hypothetical protein [Solirubrobacterales bacterium]
MGLSMPPIKTALRLAASLVAVLGCAAAPASGQSATDLTGCDRLAAPTGTDLASGSVTAPVRSLQALADRVGAGQTGCLASGEYAAPVTIIRRAGRAGEPLVLRSARGARVVVRGQLRIDKGADHVHVRDLVLDGSNPAGRASPQVNARWSRFEGNDVSNRVDTCFGLGDTVWGVADDATIAGNVIHHCGVHGTNMDHGVYIRQAARVSVLRNVIRDNPDRGVQMFPNADRSLVSGNLISGNGEGIIFSGDSDETSDGNIVADNRIVASKLRWDVESYWMPGVVGTGNELHGNCVGGGRRGAIQTPSIGFTVVSTLPLAACPLQDPQPQVPAG